MSRVYLPRYVPPSGFGYPLDGFLPPGPRRPCFMPTALLGFRPSEPSSLKRHPERFRSGRTRLPFPWPLLPRTNPQAGPASRGFRALTLPRAPCPPDAVNAARAGCSPGLWTFPGHPAERLTRTPARVPPSRLRTCSSAYCKPRRPGVSIGARLAPSRLPGPAVQQDRAALIRFPHRSAPAVRVWDNPGYGFTSRAGRHYCRSRHRSLDCPSLPEPTGPKVGAKQAKPLGCTRNITHETGQASEYARPGAIHNPAITTYVRPPLRKVLLQRGVGVLEGGSTFSAVSAVFLDITCRPHNSRHRSN